uniref:Uncharacterized protein n=1 Tax=Ralstonia syzygii R24 TaxID=907261 RepID=G3A4D4_9RALS|nr:hypothetical protein RALSY_30522 [Ralstonia syzygii R24]
MGSGIVTRKVLLYCRMAMNRSTEPYLRSVLVRMGPIPTSSDGPQLVLFPQIGLCKRSKSLVSRPMQVSLLWQVERGDLHGGGSGIP